MSTDLVNFLRLLSTCPNTISDLGITHAVLILIDCHSDSIIATFVSDMMSPG